MRAVAQRSKKPASGPERFEGLLRKVERQGPRGLSDDELGELLPLYRRAVTQLARLREAGHDPRALERMQALVTRAHGVLHRRPPLPLRTLLGRALRFLAEDCPRAIRAEWRLVGACLLAFYGLAIASFVLVARDLELAYWLYDDASVATQIEQLRDTAAGVPFRGNFTFGMDRSSTIAGFIIGHNILVSVLFFGAGLVPPVFLFVLVTNGLMLGTYTGVASHWDQAGSISSILWCHGTIELQMIVLAGAAGLVLARAVVLPGPWTRRSALARSSRRAWCLLAPMFPFLTLSGLIEGYVSPHAPAGVRIGVALASGLLLVLWVVLGGRERASAP